MSNTIGSIYNNQGIITQGQVGNNYIFQQVPPTVLFKEDLPSKELPNGTTELSTVVELRAPSPPNILAAGVRKGDVVPPGGGGPMDHPIKLSPRYGGVSFISHGENDEFYVAKLQTPPAGEYIVTTKVRDPKSKPHIVIQTQ